MFAIRVRLVLSEGNREDRMTDVPGPTPPTPRRDTLGRVLKVIGVVLLVPSAGFLVLALLTLAAGDGMTDAAPWWLFFLVVGLCLGVPGGLVLLAVRLRSRWSRVTPPQPSSPSDRV